MLFNLWRWILFSSVINVLFIAIVFNCLRCTWIFVPPSHSCFVDGTVFVLTIIFHSVHPFHTWQHSVWGFLCHKCLHCYTFLCYQRQAHYGLLSHERVLWDESRMTSALNITVGLRLGKKTLYLHTQTGCLNLFTDAPYSILWYTNNLHNALQLSGMPRSTIQQLHVAPWKKKTPCSSWLWR